MSPHRIPYKYLLTASLVILLALATMGAKANELAIGKKAKTNAAIMIPINGPVELDWKTRDQVLALREKELQKYRQLLFDEYMPGECFDLIEDDRPWWGLYGLHVYRQGMHAIDGPSKESEYLLNPYRLVAAEPNNIGIFRPTLKESVLKSPDFPFVWHSSPIKFDPYNCTAQVTYDVTGYHKQLAKYIPTLNGDTVIQNFSLIAYNARDLGLPFMYMDPNKSINITPWATRDVFEIPQMIHCGGSCGYPGGCNNMSPHRVELDNNHLKKLPARAYLKLWAERPRDPLSTPADFVMVVDFI